MKPVEGSPITDRSGTIRMVCRGVDPGCDLPDEGGSTGGRDAAATRAAVLTEVQSSFHTDSVSGLMSVTASPPTPVT
jgi:hypothetical protein